MMIGDWRGTRNVLGLLLMTFGLDAAVSLLHPRTWVAGLLAEEAARRHDAGRRSDCTSRFCWMKTLTISLAISAERCGLVSRTTTAMSCVSRTTET